nr:Gag-Pol polyprotein [Tanacetum cinerariifolium]
MNRLRSGSATNLDRYEKLDRQYAGNSAGYNDVIGNQVIQNAVYNPRVQNIKNQNGLIGVQGNGNHNQIGNGNLMAARAEGNAARQNGYQIGCYNCRGTDSAPVYDLDGSAELSKEKSTVSFFRNEKKKFKSDFKTREDELLDKQIQLKKKIKELNNILLKTGQTIHMLSPKPDSFYHTEHKMDLGYQNLFYLKKAQKKQQSLYDKKVLLEKHDPPVVHDSEEILQLAQESVDNTKTRRPQPMSNTKHDRVPSASKSSRSKNKEDEVEEHHMNLLLSKNNKHISLACNNITIDSQDVISKVVCARGRDLMINVCIIMRMAKTLVIRNKRPRQFDQEGKTVDSSESESQSDCTNGDNACTSNILEPKIKRFPNSTSLLDRLFRFVYGASIRVVPSLLKFKYHKEHLCPSCEQGKSKRASYPPKLVPNSRQRLHLLHTDLCGPIRIASINGRRYVLVIVDDYSRYTWVHFLTSKDEAPAVIITFLKNGSRFFFIIATSCFIQNRSIIHCRFNKTPYELINGRKPDISFLHVFDALCYPKNDREDIRKLGAKGDIGFFIGSKHGLQSMTYGQISLGLDLTYAPSTITTQQPTEGELDLLFEAMYDDYIGGQPSATGRIVSPAQEPKDVEELNSNAMVDGNTFVNDDGKMHQSKNHLPL